MTPETTSARRMSHCKHLPRYIVAVEVSEKLELERDNYKSALRRALEALMAARDCGCEISLEGAIEAARQSLHNVKCPPTGATEKEVEK